MSALAALAGAAPVQRNIVVACGGDADAYCPIGESLVVFVIGWLLIIVVALILALVAGGAIFWVTVAIGHRLFLVRRQSETSDRKRDLSGGLDAADADP